jgi:TonB family protein
MSRRWLITVSLVAHAGIGMGMIASGVWRIDRLDADHRSSIGLGVMTPPGLLAEGGHAKAGEAPKLVPKKKQEQRKVTKDLTQLAPKEKEPTPVVATAASDDDGNGEGEGMGKGTKTGIGIDTPTDTACPPGQDCTGGGGGGSGPVCGNAIVEAGETCDDGNRTAGDGCSAVCGTEPKQQSVILPPNVLGGLRTTGDTQIHPPATVKTEMQRDGRDRVTGTVKLCLDTAGRVASAQILGSTKYPAYDALLVAKVREWHYRPYAVNGTPMPACSAVTFQYSMR